MLCNSFVRCGHLVRGKFINMLQQKCFSRWSNSVPNSLRPHLSDVRRSCIARHMNCFISTIPWPFYPPSLADPLHHLHLHQPRSQFTKRYVIARFVNSNSYHLGPPVSKVAQDDFGHGSVCLDNCQFHYVCPLCLQVDLHVCLCLSICLSVYSPSVCLSLFQMVFQSTHRSA